ncbi:MAG: c-type cytochrome, partial [Thiobacillus sp.]
GAPTFDNKGDWAARIGKGYDTLVKHAIEGFNQMPARGGDGDLSDVEVARAVAYMANSAGASFSAPEPSAAVAAAGTAGGGAKGNPAKGKAVYEAHCAACHAAGVAGAPKFGDKAAWEKRISQGYAILLEHATKGIGAMPAKGGADISDAELADAVAYLYDSNGGKL